MAVQRKYERDIDILLAEEFAVSPDFAGWFIEAAGKPDWANATVKDVFVSRADASGESDLEVVFSSADGGSFGVLIEDKIDAPFQQGQFERYVLRAQRGMARGDFDDFRIVLCAPDSYPASSAHASRFHGFVSYELIATAIERFDATPRGLYRANFIRTAASKASNVRERVDDAATNRFWDEGYELASRKFPILEMKKGRRSKDSNWISLRPHDLPTVPKRVSVEVKGAQGQVDLTFSETEVQLFEPEIRGILAGRTAHQTGRATAIRTTTSPFRVTDGLEVGLPKLEDAFGIAADLVRFYRANRESLDRAAKLATP